MATLARNFRHSVRVFVPGSTHRCAREHGQAGMATHTIERTDGYVHDSARPTGGRIARHTLGVIDQSGRCNARKLRSGASSKRKRTG